MQAGKIRSILKTLINDVGAITHRTIPGDATLSVLELDQQALEDLDELVADEFEVSVTISPEQTVDQLVDSIRQKIKEQNSSYS